MPDFHHHRAGRCQQQQLLLLLLLLLLLCDDSLCICVCNVAISDGRSLLCREFSADSAELDYIGSSSVVARAESCDSIVSLELRQPRRLLRLRPGGLAPLRSLRSLRLIRVGLRSPLMPESLAGLGQLETLEIEGPHSLRRLLSHTFRHTTALTRLSLRDNGIEFVEPDAFCEAFSLRRLDLSGNRLAAFNCRLFAGLSGLKFLNVTMLSGQYSNDILSVPDCLACPLVSLETIVFDSWRWREVSGSARVLHSTMSRQLRLRTLSPVTYRVLGLVPFACDACNSGECSWQHCLVNSTVSMATAGATTESLATSLTTMESVATAIVTSGVSVSPSPRVAVVNVTGVRSDGADFLENWLTILVFAILVCLAILVLIVFLVVCCLARNRKVKGELAQTAGDS